MLIKLLTGQPDYEKALRYRRLACLALLAVGLVGLACYALLVPRSGLGDYAQGFYLGAACGITGGALVLLLRTRYLQTAAKPRSGRPTSGRSTWSTPPSAGPASPPSTPPPGPSSSCCP